FAGGRRRPRVQSVGGSDATVSARPAVRAGRPHADGTGIGAGNDPLRRHEASPHPRTGGPDRHAAERPGKAPLPQPGAHPADARPLDRQVQRASRLGARGTQTRVGEDEMTTTTMAAKNATTQIYRVWIKATPEAIWDAITRPEFAKRYGYCVPIDIDLRPGGKYRAYANDGMK